MKPQFIEFGVSKKSFEEKRMRNTKIFFNGVFLSIDLHLLKKLELFRSCRKKVTGLYKSKKELTKKFRYFNFYQEDILL